MEGLLKEILEIPDRTNICYQKNRGITLPLNVPYLGMGASYYAALTLFYCGKNINLQIASEYYYYFSKNIQPLGVLISQSGESSETIWNAKRFKKIIAITNNQESTLAKSKNIKRIIQLYAGEEKFPSTKTYLNTLIVLYLGMGINPLRGIYAIKESFNSFETQMRGETEKISKYIISRQNKGLYIIGSGPNIGTAQEGALTLSETTKFSWIGLPIAQYEHGPIETAENTVIIILNSNGKERKRIELIKRKLKEKSNALIIELTERRLPENLTPFTLVAQLNFIMNYLADYMNIKNRFQIGRKITKISDSLK